MPLAGDASSLDAITATLSRVLGRPLRFEQVSWEQCVAEQGEELMLMYRYFDRFGMDGVPQYMHRFHPDAMTFEAYLRGAGWGDAVTSAAAG